MPATLSPEDVLTPWKTIKKRLQRKGVDPASLPLVGRDEKRLTDWLDKPAGNFPIAKLPSGIQKAIKADTGHVFLSAETMAKQRRNHPELTAEEYAMLPNIIASGTAVFDAPRSAIIIHSADRRRVAVVKSTNAGHEIYLTSFRRVKNDREVNRLKSKGDEIKRL